MEWVDLTEGGWSRTADCNVVRPSEHATGAFAEGDSETIQRAYIGLSGFACWLTSRFPRAVLFEADRS